jgi:hypothetical protein
MILFHVILLSVILVSLGYICSWTAMHENTPKSLSGFGKVMATILYVFAALVIVFGLSYGRHYCMNTTMGSMEKMGMPCMSGMYGMSCMGGVHGMKGAIPESMAAKEEMIVKMKGWKMRNPKEWKESLEEIDKTETVK